MIVFVTGLTVFKPRKPTFQFYSLFVHIVHVIKLSLVLMSSVIFASLYGMYFTAIKWPFGPFAFNKFIY